MKKRCLKLITAFLLTSVCIVYSKAGDSQTAKENCSIQSLPSKTFFFVQLDSIKTGNDISELKKEFSDSFFCDAANQLLTYHLSQYHVPVANVNDSVLSKMRVSSIKAYSPLNGDTGVIDSTAEIIREIAQRSKAELVIIPYSCNFQQKVLTKKGWRDGRGGPSYQRPVKNIVDARVHLQIWDKSGTLVCECVGDGKDAKPMFYSFFSKRVKINTVVTYSRKVFANPFVRALNKAARELVKN